MTKIFFTPGPSQLYPTVSTHIEEALENNIVSISHRSKQFEELFSLTVMNIRKLMNIPENYHIFFLSSGTEAMERVIQNCVEKESLHFVNGSFSKRFYETAGELGKDAKKIEVEWGKGFDFSLVETRHGVSLHCFTHNETSTGVMLPLKPIYAIKKQNSDKLIVLDIVSSAPYADVDFHYLDCVFFSVQKLFGLPAGLGVIIVSPQAMEKAEYLQNKNISIGSYHSFSSLLKYAQKNQTPETPPVFHIYLLNKVIENMLQIGIETIRKQTDEKAKMIYDFLDSHKKLSAFVENKQFRSPTVITVQTDEHTQKIKKYLEEKGIIVGSGYGKNKDVQIRIANFPAVTKRDIKRLLQYLSEYSF